MPSKIKKVEIDIHEQFAVEGSVVFSKFKHALWMIQGVYLHDLSAFYTLLDHIKTVHADTIKQHPKSGWWGKVMDSKSRIRGHDEKVR
jgi:hypothetical protein